MELQRALSDLAEVRSRLAIVQRFEGYSSQAAVASGALAIAAGGFQARLAPYPHTPSTVALYVTIWLACLAGALVLNYGAAVLWVWRHRGPASISQLQLASLALLPAIVLGGVFSLALVLRAQYDLLPGTWFACYALGLFGSRAMLPRAMIIVSLAFGMAGTALLLMPAQLDALRWWIMPAGFGFGQIAIGLMLAYDREYAGAGTW
jgi:uncharacterized membrane protein